MRLEDLLQVFRPHAPVPDVVGIDRDRDASAAVLEAVRAVDHHTIAKTALLHHRLEGVEDGFGALRGARALGVLRRAEAQAAEHEPLRLWPTPIIVRARPSDDRMAPPP